MHALKAGDLLGGKYRLIRLLGQGGMGTVWHAQHLSLNASVALKFVTSNEMDAQGLQRFLGEARMAAALRSPHVVQILDYGVLDGIPHIAMELLEGQSLAERLAREGRLDVGDTARVIQHVVRAIGRAHDAGIVHRDLKPENVFIVRNDDEELIKVLDFGIAKGNAATLGDSAAFATRPGALLGTPHYMSPEQVDGVSAVDYRTDIWSLGVIAYRCLLGKLPFAGDSVGRLVLAICSRPLPVPSEIGPVPAGFDAWFRRACARDPAARFASARQAANDFLALSQAPSHESKEAGGETPASLRTQSETLATTGQSINMEIAPAKRRGRWAKKGLVAVLVAVSLIWMLSSTPVPRAPEVATGSESAAPPRAEPPAASRSGRTSKKLPKPESPAMPRGLTGAAIAQGGTPERPPARAHVERPPDALRPTLRGESTPTEPRAKRHPKAKPLERVPEMPPPNIDLGI